MSQLSQAPSADEIYRLFQAGKSKADIGKMLGIERSRVAKMLAKAIQERARHGNG